MSVLHHCTSVRKVSDFVLLWHCENFNADVGYIQHDISTIVSSKKKFGTYSCDGQYETDSSYVRGYLSEITPGINVAGNPFTLDGDFTFDFWAYPVADNVFFGFVFQGKRAIFKRTDATTAGTCTWSIGYPVAKYAYESKTISWPANTWGHVAAIRDGNYHYLLCNGKLVYVLEDSSWVASSGGIFICGEDNLGTINSRYVDEVALRLFAAWDCSGAVVGDEVFTPPTAPYEA